MLTPVQARAAGAPDTARQTSKTAQFEAVDMSPAAADLIEVGLLGGEAR